jgi:ABC-type transport system involved in cytochrome c biogenesis permease component
MKWAWVVNTFWVLAAVAMLVYAPHLLVIGAVVVALTSACRRLFFGTWL